MPSSAMRAFHPRLGAPSLTLRDTSSASKKTMSAIVPSEYSRKNVQQHTHHHAARGTAPNTAQFRYTPYAGSSPAAAVWPLRLYSIHHFVSTFFFVSEAPSLKRVNKRVTPHGGVQGFLWSFISQRILSDAPLPFN